MAPRRSDRAQPSQPPGGAEQGEHPTGDIACGGGCGAVRSGRAAHYHRAGVIAGSLLCPVIAADNVLGQPGLVIGWRHASKSVPSITRPECVLDAGYGAFSGGFRFAERPYGY